MQQGLPDRQSRRDAMIVAGETRGTHNPEGMAGCCKGCHPFGVGNKPLPKLESVHPFGVGENYSIFGLCECILTDTAGHKTASPKT